jgi:amino acid adenylation domain-containing protein
MTHRALFEGFLNSAETYPERPALLLGEDVVTYAQLRTKVTSIAATIDEHRSPQSSALTCVLGQRTLSSFAGILGALCSGDGYVPMLPTYPPARIATMIDRSESRTLVVDALGMRVLAEVLALVSHPLTVISLDVAIDEDLAAEAGRHKLLGPDDLLSSAQWVAPSVRPDDIAYLLFTSGSTGQPKAVMVAHRNIARFLDFVVDRYDLGPDDRFSHMFEVTFDLSLFDLFGAWQVGGCLCVPDARARLLPAGYVVDAGITVWFSVPSTALLMQQTRTLAPGAFPDLRWALFCGEALTVSVAEAFAAAAPNAPVENLYGPTELTLACTLYRHGPDTARHAVGGIMPIGAPFSGMRAKVLDEQLREVGPGESGELSLTGPQVALGYWRDPERTAQAFVVPPGETETFYRTGDLVMRPVVEGDPLLFKGRLDSQVKIRGYRVELGEIEAALREAAGLDAAVALGWPVADNGGAEGVVAFIADASVDVDALLSQLAQRLPRYMIPRDVHVIGEFPLNSNGKIDRNALRATLDEAR